jgi:Anti-sigma factor NepR
VRLTRHRALSLLQTAPTQAPDEPAAILDERIQTQIGQQLSSFYKELVNQPIPQNFIDLLAKLDRQEDGK